MRKGEFSTTEEQFIKENYLKLNRKEISKILNRSEDSIRHKLKAIELYKSSGKTNNKDSIIKYREKQRREDLGRLRLLKFINSQYTDKNYYLASDAFRDKGRDQILKRYNKIRKTCKERRGDHGKQMCLDL